MSRRKGKTIKELDLRSRYRRGSRRRKSYARIVAALRPRHQTVSLIISIPATVEADSRFQAEVTKLAKSPRSLIKLERALGKFRASLPKLNEPWKQVQVLFRVTGKQAA